MIAGVVVLLLVLQLVLVGSPLGPSQVARGAPSADLSIGFLQTIDSLNPFIGINDASYVLYGLLYDYPFSFDQDGNYVPNLITSAACAVANCSVWNYAVRPGVQWSDGTNLTVNDVAFTWNYDSQNLSYLWAFEPYFNQVVHCTAANAGRCGAQISGPWNVTLYFQRPFASGQNLFAPIVEQAQWSGVSPQAAETSYANANPIGTGPFIADPNIYNEWLQNGAVPLHVYRNPYYHPVGSHVGPGNISNIYLRAYQDPNSLALALENGDIQLAQFPPSAVQSLQGRTGIQVQQALQAIQEWNEIGISQIDVSAADVRLNPARFDYRVREAMARATNKDYILQNYYYGYGVRGDSLVSPITPQWWYDPVAGGDNLTFNISAANAVLNADGWTGNWSDSTGTYRMNPNPITVSYQTSCYQCVSPTNVTKTIPAGTHLAFTLATRPQSVYPEEVNTANYLAAQYKQIGIKITLKVETTENALSSDVYGGYVEMYIWYWSGDPDPNYILSMQSSWTLDGWNDDYWNNGTYNGLFLAQLGETNSVTRQAEVRSAEKLFYETGVYIIYVFPYGNWAMRTDTVPGGQQWTGWGNWSQHPFRQMNAYWGANPLWFGLACPVCVPVGGPNQPPSIPVISGSKYLGTWTGATLSFTASTSDPETTDTLNWTWHWGDGSVTNATGAASNPTSTVNHSWSSVGNYTVFVSVTDGFNSYVSSLPVYVNVTPAVMSKLQGVVTNPLHIPIPGASITVNPGPLLASTNVTGSYSVTLMPGTYDILVQAPLYAPFSAANIFVPNGATMNLNFQLGWGVGWITGTVASSSGSPISGATVQATSAGGSTVSAATNAQGQYNLTLDSGAYTVNASATGFLLQSRAGRGVTNGSATTVDFALSLDHGWLTGHVTDGAGHPISSAIVRVTVGPGAPLSVSADASGAYNLTLAVGTYTLNATATGYAGQTQTGKLISSGNTTVADFALTALPGRIYGTILGPGNAPVANATVVIAQASGVGSVTLYTVTTDSLGSYSRSLPAGTYLVTATAPGYVSQNRTGIVVGPGASVAVNFTLAAQPSAAFPLSEAALVGLGALVGAVAAIVVILLLRRRKTGRGERPPE